MTKPLWQHTATELLALRNRNDVSAQEVLRSFIERRNEVDGKINAVIATFDEEAMAEAAKWDNPHRTTPSSANTLQGLPVSIKESIDMRGKESTLGMRARRGSRAPEDAVVVQEIRRVGGVPFCKTNVPQTLLSPMETVNFIWGQTNNPWRLTHATGASSGGEGAALASGQSVLGIGTDVGGSIRFPAHFCGICGLKPTLHRWSNMGSGTAYPGQQTVRAQIGPMARNVSDLTLLAGALDPVHMAKSDPDVPPIPFEVAPWSAEDGPDLAGVRIGFFEDDGLFTPSLTAKRALRHAVNALERRGAEVIPVRANHTEELVFLMIRALSADGAHTIDRQLSGEEVIKPLKLMRTAARLPTPARLALALTLRAQGEPRTAKLVQSLGEKPVHKLWKLNAERARHRQEELRRWNEQGITALICPAHIVCAAPHGMADDFTLAFSYAARFNVLDLPAGVVPVTRVRSNETQGRMEVEDKFDRTAYQIERRGVGMPMGVQVAARPYEEHRVLQIMSAIEAELKTDPEYPVTPVTPA